jgi:hypothetical protein
MNGMIMKLACYGGELDVTREAPVSTNSNTSAITRSKQKSKI